MRAEALDSRDATDLWRNYQAAGIEIRRLRRDAQLSDRWWFDLILPLDLDVGQSEGVQAVVVVRNCKARRMASGRYHVWPPETRTLEGWYPLLLLPASLRRLVCTVVRELVERDEGISPAQMAQETPDSGEWLQVTDQGESVISVAPARPQSMCEWDSRSISPAIGPLA